VRTLHQDLHYPFIYQMSCFFNHVHFCFLGVAVFINTIFRELKSNYKCSWTEEGDIDKLHAFENKVIMKLFGLG